MKINLMCMTMSIPQLPCRLHRLCNYVTPAACITVPSSAQSVTGTEG